jgi:hypothetical protein
LNTFRNGKISLGFEKTVATKLEENENKNTACRRRCSGKRPV